MRLVIALGAALLVVAGCAKGSDTPGTAPSVSALDIPAVARSLDVSGYATAPCRLLDESQRRELGLVTAGRAEGSGAGTCDLRTAAEGADSLTYLRLVVFDGVGLDDRYAQCGTLDCSRWTVDDIDGFAVVRATDEMIVAHGSCALLLGVAGDATVAITDVAVGSGVEGPDCDRADRVASMVLTTLG